MKEKSIHEIRTGEQYQDYLFRIDALMDVDPASNSADGLLLEKLVVLIQEYERKKGWELQVPT